MSYTASCPGLRRSSQEKHRRPWTVQGVSLPEHTSREWGNAHRHQNTVQGPAEHTATGCVEAGAGIYLFQLGHVWLSRGFFEFLSTTPLWGSMSEPSSWGFFWHWSRHLGLSLSYFIPFVMWISLYIFHIALTWTIPVYLLCKLKAHCFSQVLKSIALILNESFYHRNLSRITWQIFHYVSSHL